MYVYVCIHMYRSRLRTLSPIHSRTHLAPNQPQLAFFRGLVRRALGLADHHFPIETAIWGVYQDTPCIPVYRPVYPLDKNKHVDKLQYVSNDEEPWDGWPGDLKCHSSQEPAVFGPDRLHLLRYGLRLFLLHPQKIWSLMFGLCGSNMILPEMGYGPCL